LAQPRAAVEEAGIDPEQCFFTNAYMGLRAGQRATGPFPGARDPGFVERCRRFLGAQIEVQRPRLILTLGTYVPAVLAPLAPKLVRWRDVANLREIDAARCPVVLDARFIGAGDGPTAVVALTHPSHRPLNVGQRCYRGAVGGRPRR